ncbi:carboxypeptidase PM20D1 [Conyzicola lurida]|uniref:Carboxypeptidase PM20D1 n=1 Tax=Conyzicola lurida TaxID=1172621 RepID=A0A841AG12_9MICO|nr:M20/M25/M40 family metallo-hydrolase [Conyzicola lurida]MBB5842740.1 carboxypeptidase PM20D1 [Conyzicola lurida]
MTARTSDDELSLARFQALLRIPTVSRLDESQTDWARFDEFVEALPGLYPALHAALDRELVDGHSLLYRWAGSGDGAPTVLMAHYDVVAATDEGWDHPPFAAERVDSPDGELIWGRGTLDDKGALVSILEAVEARAAEGFVPARDVYLSFGHNEETTGGGAQAVVALLEARGIRPALVIDEGGAVVEGVFPGVAKPTAVVGVSEKGITTLTLTVEQEGGHASTPPRLTATARLSRAIVRLNASPFPARFTPTNLEMLRTVGAHASGPIRFAFTNLWLTRPLLLRLFGRLSDETNAMIRTTQAVTQLSAGLAANALAERAVATVNMRVAVGSTVQESVRHVRTALRDDAVRIDVQHPSEPSPVSPTTGRAWDLLARTIDETFDDVIVTPYIQLGASDSRHFTRISDHVYRFSPFEMTGEQRATLHAKNERMSVDTWLRGVGFYRRLIGSL